MEENVRGLVSFEGGKSLGLLKPRETYLNFTSENKLVRFVGIFDPNYDGKDVAVCHVLEETNTTEEKYSYRSEGLYKKVQEKVYPAETVLIISEGEGTEDDPFQVEVGI